MWPFRIIDELMFIERFAEDFLVGWFYFILAEKIKKINLDASLKKKVIELPKIDSNKYLVFVNIL